MPNKVTFFHELIHRFTTVFVGLIALNYVEVSFTETVKSTAPAFTVVLARLIVGNFIQKAVLYFINAKDGI